MINRPRFVYTDDASVSVDLTLSIPSRFWLPGSKGIGGIEFSAAPVPSSWEHRVDRTLRQPLRFMESEYEDVEKLLEHARRGKLITVYPNADEATSRDCYADPAWARRLWDEGILPQEGEYAGELVIPDAEWMSTGASWAGVLYHG